MVSAEELVRPVIVVRGEGLRWVAREYPPGSGQVKVWKVASLVRKIDGEREWWVMHHLDSERLPSNWVIL